MAGIYNRESLYQENIVDGRVEFDMGSIDFPELINDKDVSWTAVKSSEECRPDLISYRLYDTPDLWWFILWLNGIMDVWNELKSGVALKYIPKYKIDNSLKYKRIRRK